MLIRIFVITSSILLTAFPALAQVTDPATAPTTAPETAPVVDATAISPDSPKGVGLRLVDALAHGDADAAIALIVDPDAVGPTVTALAEMSNAMRELVDKAIAKWGDEGQMIAMADPSRRMHQRISAAEERIEGDTAVLTAPTVPEPMMLQRVNGQWKIDLALGQSAEEMKRLIPFLTRSAELARETAEEIDAGKFNSAAEMSQAMATKMQQAMQQQQQQSQEQTGSGATTEPAPQ